MKRIFSLFMTVCLCFSAFGYASAEGDNKYSFYQLGYSISIPDDLVTFSTIMKSDDPALSQTDLSFEEIQNILKENQLALMGIAPDHSIMLTLSYHTTDMRSFAETGEALQKQFLDDPRVDDFSRNAHDVWLLKMKGKIDNGYAQAYRTVHQGYDFTLRFESAAEPTEKQYEQIRRCADSVELFDILNAQPQAEPYVSQETQTFTFTDPNSGSTFALPVDWKQKDDVPPSAMGFRAEFVQETSHKHIIYACADLYNTLSYAEKQTTKRSDFQLTDDFIRQLSGVDADYETKTFGQNEFTILTGGQTADIVIALHVENGYMFQIMYSGTIGDASYNVFTDMLASVAFRFDDLK